MRNLKIWLIISLCISVIVSQRNPGVVISLKPKLIDDLKLKFLPDIISQFSEQTLPDVEQKVKIPVIGEISFRLSNLHLSIRNIIPQNIQLFLNSPNRILASVRGPYGGIRGNAQIKLSGLIPITINTDVLAEVRNINVDVEVSVGRIPNQSRPDKMGPYVKIEQINFIGNLDISVSLPGASVAKDIINAIARVFVGIFNKQVRDVISIIVKSVAANQIPNQLGKIPLFQEIPSTGLAVDYSLTKDPIIQPDSFIAALDSSISDKKTLNENFPFPGPSELPPIKTNDKLLQVFITEYVFNSFGYSLYASGNIGHLRIKPEIEIGEKISLNVLVFAVIWPNLLDKYKFTQLVEFDCGCNSYPFVRFKENNIEINADFACSFLVKMDDGSYDTAFKVDLKIAFGSFLLVEKGKIKVQISSTDIKEFSTIDSKIGSLNLDKLQDAANFLFKIGQPIANAYLSKKLITIPTVFDIDFGDAVVEIHEKYVKLDLSPVFHTSPLRKKIFKKEKFDIFMNNTLKLLLKSHSKKKNNL